MKRFSKFAAVLLMLVCTFFGLAACNKVERIGIEKDKMPRVIFVQGQDLDLSSGFLTVKDKKGTKDISFDSKGVSIKGYDKDTLGEQQLTVSYEGKKTQLKVTVVARIVVENYENSYFVGTEFNKEKGRLVITKDDGTSSTVQMNDPNVSVEGFDASNAASPLTLTARYQNGDVNYTGTFNVNIYNVESVDFLAPRKTSYKSHDEGIDLNGGYFTIKANSGALTDYVALTADMASGFDLSAATEANREEPLVQTITFDYLGKKYTYDIKITYTDVTQIKKNAATLSALDWSGNAAPAISAEQGALAMETAELYFGLSSDEKALITEEERLSFVRAATVYGYDKWKEDIDRYAKVFTVSDDGKLSLTCETYADTKAALTGLQNKETPVYTAGELLSEISSSFAKSVLFGETTIEAKLAGVFKPGSFTTVLSKLEFMITLYEKLQNVPAEWTAESLASHKTALDGAVDYISEKAYTSLNDRGLYTAVANWREDYFDILYTYYYDVGDNDSIAVLEDLHLPGKLEELYTLIRLAVSRLGYADSKWFMVYYNNAMSLASEIVNGSDEMYKSLYKSITIGNYLSNSNGYVDVTFNDMLYFARTSSSSSSVGYVYRSGSLLDDAEYESLWELYIGIANKAAADEKYTESVDYENDMQSLLNSFVALSPAKQRVFLVSVNVNYSAGKFMALDFSDGANTSFISDLAGYYTEKLSDDGDVLFADLMLAIEYYMNRYNDSTGQTVVNFVTRMNKINAEFEKMSDADKALVRQYFGTVIDQYNRYAKDYANFPDSIATIDLGNYADDFQAIADAIVKVDTAYAYVQKNYALFAPLLSAYEEAEVLVNGLLKKATDAGDTDIVYAYYHQVYAIAKNYALPLSYAMQNYRSAYLWCLTDYSKVGNYLFGSSVPLYNYYNQEELQPFMADASYVIWTGMNFNEEVETNFRDKTRVLNAMKAFRELDAENQYLFLLLDNKSGNYYYKGIALFLQEVLSSDAMDAANKLLEVEQSYVIYMSNPDGKYENGTTYKQNLLDKMAKVDELCIALGNNNATALATFMQYLGDMYNFYNDACTKLNTTQA